MFDIAAPFFAGGRSADQRISVVFALAVCARTENRSDITVRFVTIPIWFID
jgi:hypothetical protein